MTPSPIRLGFLSLAGWHWQALEQQLAPFIERLRLRSESRRIDGRAPASQAIVAALSARREPLSARRELAT